MLANKGIELATESIPGCVLQLYVWLTNPGEAGTYALPSIIISALTTGFTSAMMAYDMDVDVPHRQNQPKFYGYIPDDNGLRSRCFVLMTLISALQNLNRGVGCALAATGGKFLSIFFIGGEIVLYLIYKKARGDFFCFYRIEGLLAIFVSLIQRILVKVISDFSGCLHFRHPYELGGLAFSVSMVWAQIFPFVALQLYEVDNEDGKTAKDAIAMVLVVIFSLWIVLNIVFFCTIDLKYIGTFFGLKTAPQYTCERFLDVEADDGKRWSAAFENRMSYKNAIKPQVKEWVGNNIVRWRREQPSWFNIEKIPDDYLPTDVFEAEGGACRRRSKVSLREIVGLNDEDGDYTGQNRIHPEP